MSSMSKPFYSIGMIFKNEIRCLERCLKSLEPLRKAVPCELVMADTGSTDGSRKIAEKYADVLFDFEWVDDFAAARNAVMDRCSGQWYLSIDADEWLKEDIDELLLFTKAKTIAQDYAAVNIRNYKTDQLEKVDQYVDFKAVRMARLSTGVRYNGRIHEQWGNSLSKERTQAVTLDRTWLYHDGYAYFSETEAAAKHNRNMALLKKKLEEHPEDLKTYVECMDSSKLYDADSAEYARQALKVLNHDLGRWDRFTAVVYRGAVSVAKIHALPEFEEWVAEAVARTPKSMFTRIDTAYYAVSYYWEKDEYEKCIPWCEMYQRGIEDYEASRFDANEMLYGVVEWVSPVWVRKEMIIQSECYLNCKSYAKAFEMLEKLTHQNLDAEQTCSVTLMTLRLHREAEFDTPALMTAFWENLTRELPKDMEEAEKVEAKQNLDAFTKEAYGVFTPKYRREERAKENFLRHSYTIFLPLDGRDDLGNTAAILETEDPAELTARLNRVEKLDDLPIYALSHAITRGVAFPLPGKPLKVEEMDRLISRLTQDQESFFPLTLKTLEGNFAQTLQSLCWARGLALAALRTVEWGVGKIPEGSVITLSLDGPAQPMEDVDKRNLAVARAFARVEKAYLPVCYAPEMLKREALFMLPPLHRFGWYCAQAFQTLDRGDQVGYVRLLREGLSICEDAKDIVEFLIDHIPETQPQAPSVEMAALADQVRSVLAQYSPDDPAVAALKQSEAYQKVAHLIEGLEPPVAGGQLQ